MNFQPVDRLPRIEWASWWGETIERWRAEGLPASLKDPFDIRQYLGLDPYWQRWLNPLADTFPRPKQYGQGFVNSHDDYSAIKQHLYPPRESDIDVIRPWAAAQRRGEVVVWITLEGFFWFPRRLFGIENHLYAFYDHPDLMHRINQDLADYNIRILHQLSKVCRPTFMTFAEDMSYNHGPMISKGLFDEFLAPYYRQVIPVIKEMGTFVFIDSDGDVTEMIPWLMEVGIEGVLPLERQAGVDAAALRRSHPGLLMIGHYDKMVMPGGERAMRDEFERLLPVMRSGGFIPSVDHQTPPGVSLEQYRCYLRLLEEYSELAAA